MRSLRDHLGAATTMIAVSINSAKRPELKMHNARCHCRKNNRLVDDHLLYRVVMKLMLFAPTTSGGRRMCCCCSRG
jgi:hypothetical protein